jgi:hypothetical protein
MGAAAPSGLATRLSRRTPFRLERWCWNEGDIVHSVAENTSSPSLVISLIVYLIWLPKGYIEMYLRES